MARTSYYCARSLDGFIARPQEDQVDWLEPFYGNLGTPYDYERYLETVSAVVIGRKSLEVALKLGPLPVDGRPTFVYTRNPAYRPGADEVTVVADDVPGHIHRMKQEHEGRVWVFGGGGSRCVHARARSARRAGDQRRAGHDRQRDPLAGPRLRGPMVESCRALRRRERSRTAGL